MKIFRMFVAVMIGLGLTSAPMVFATADKEEMITKKIDDKDVIKMDKDVVKKDEEMVKEDKDVVKKDEEIVKEDKDVVKKDEGMMKDDN